MLHYKNALELDLAREREKNRDGFVEKEPKDHQRRAIKKLNEFYSKTGQRGILVLPTGAGKTYTAAYWLIKQIIPKSIKILWLADQGFLLEQAYETFRANILEVPHRTRTQIRMRIVSGSPRHADGNSISIDDDILLMTAQTAVSQWQSQAIDDNGKVVQTKLHAFLEHSSKESNIFIVYDEAHHTPAFGRRNLLVGGSGNYTGILEKFPQAQLLGLTATPTYTDSTQRGWLWKIFTGGIIHSEQKATLEDAGILAAAKYQAEKTNFKFTISDSEVEQVMLNHKELPARIVDEIAKNEERNRYIAEFYLKNQKTLGKTIIFLDRWYQCRTIENKLNSMAGKQIAASVFSYVDREKSIEYINSRSSDENDKNLDLFRAGKIQILLNVKMLTEGVDVPDVNSVFITRETNSTILFTQMVGRALRGRQAGGGKDEANIVFFTDNWSKHVQFASTSLLGGAEDKATRERGHRPIELISIDLIDKIQFQMDNQDFEVSTYDLIPIGWFSVTYVDTLTEEVDGKIEKNLETFNENVLVFEGELKGFQQLADDFLANKIDEFWEKEEIDPGMADEITARWVKEYFPDKQRATESDRMRFTQLARHWGQMRTTAEYFSFDQKKSLDLRPHVESTYSSYTREQTVAYLEAVYNTPENSLIRVVYPDFSDFKTAFEYETRAFERSRQRTPGISQSNQEIKTKRLAPETIRKMVLSRDENRCLCCGKTNGLQIDHVFAFKHQEPDDDNPEFYQTLCGTCNREKESNGFDFRRTNFALEKIVLREVKKSSPSEDPACYLQRLLNCYFATKAVQWQTVVAKDNGNAIWKANFYVGANVQETIERDKPRILSVIRKNGYSLRDIEFTEI